MRLTSHRSPVQKLLLAGLTAAALLCAIALTLLRKHEPSPAPVGDVKKPAVFVPGPQTFLPGLHVLGALTPSVAYVLETSDGLILVDCGLRESHELLLQQMKFLQLDIADLKLILITHGHGDHYLGAMQLRELTGAKIHAGAGDSQILRDAGPREAVFSTFPMDQVPIEQTSVDVELSGNETIELGEASIQVLATPGHTPGSVCYLVKWRGETVLFSGDTIMTIEGDLGTYSTYLAPKFRGDARSYLQTLKDLQRLPAPDIVLPGHPQTQRQAVSARVPPEKWSGMLSRGIQLMEDLIARYETDGADFLDGTPREITPGLLYLGDIQKMAIYCLTSGSSVVLFDAPGGEELVNFLTERLTRFHLELPMISAVVLTGTSPDLIDGLAGVVKATGARIVASESARADIQRLWPTAAVSTPEALPEPLAWLKLEHIPILGFGPDRSAWQLKLDSQRVLLSGLAPLRVPPESTDAWSLTPLHSEDARRSLERLAVARPQIWLPSRPDHGQNANLYSDDWAETLRQSRMAFGFGYR